MSEKERIIEACKADLDKIRGPMEGRVRAYLIKKDAGIATDVDREILVDDLLWMAFSVLAKHVVNSPFDVAQRMVDKVFASGENR